FALLDLDGRPDADGDVRVVAARLPPPVAAALAAPALREVSSADAMVSRLDVDGVSYLMSAAAVLGERTQGWLVGNGGPEAHYLGTFEASRRRLLAIAALILFAASAGAALVLRAMRRDLGRLIVETTNLRSFDFTPSANDASTFRDVQAASESLEQAK